MCIRDRDIVQRLKKGGGLIANFPVNEDYVKKKKTHVEYWLSLIHI